MRPLGTWSSSQRRQSPSLTRGSWISLFAMLMIFIGPLVSQSMPMDSHASMTMNMSIDMPVVDHTEHVTQPDAEHCPPHAGHHVLWEKCGYCSLLFNCPALTGGASFIGFDTPPGTIFTPPSPRLGHARQTFFPGARTRAPPIIA